MHINLINSFRCNSFCEVERGWECTLGDSSGIDTCFEVCGDSLNMKQLSCDDGNVDYPISKATSNYTILSRYLWCRWVCMELMHN